jgi:predicted  nucleic acid-binding Zn-ribbon protein
MTTPRPTARQQIADVAAEHGWTATVHLAGRVTYTRGPVRVGVAFGTTATAPVRAGDRTAPGQHSQTVGSRGKRETVIGWLTEAQPIDEQGAPTSVEQPAEQSAYPLLDATAAALARPRPFADPAPARQHVETAREQIADTAAQNGWSMFATTDRHYGFRADDLWVSVAFTEDGAIVDASRRVDGVRTPENTRQLYVVVAWLAAPSVEPPADLDMVHAHALDENADRDQDRIAELEREVDDLREVREQAVDTVREHRARIAELEAERDAFRRAGANALAVADDAVGAMSERSTQLSEALRELAMATDRAQVAERERDALARELGALSKSTTEDSGRRSDQVRALQTELAEARNELSVLRPAARRVAIAVRRQREHGPMDLSLVLAKALTDLAGCVGEPLTAPPVSAPTTEKG